MKSKMLFSIIVFAIFSSLLFQNCTRLVTFSKVADIGAATQSPISFGTLVSENNGEGYLGKPEPIEYVKSFENYDCKAGPNSTTKNIQGITVFDGDKAVITNDNCMDLNVTIGSAEAAFNIQPYNQDMFVLSNIPYEKKSIFIENSSRATEVFCRDTSDSSGMDILIKYDDVARSSAKIYLGTMDADGKWLLSKVDFFPVQKSNSAKVFSAEAFKLTLADAETAKNIFSANLEMTLDQKKISKSLNCYSMNMNPTVPSVNEPAMVAQWSFNSSLDEFVNNLTSIVVDLDQTFLFADGYFGFAAKFDGVDDHIEVAPHPEINDLPAVTVAAWVFPVSNHGGIVRKMDFGPAGQFGGWNFGISNETGRLFFEASFSDGFLRVEVLDRVLELSTWNHVAVTWDGSSIPNRVVIYINGKIAPTASQLATVTGTRLTDQTFPLVIGDRAEAEMPLFEGLIDQVIIWNRPLIDSEISNLHKNGVPN